MLRPGGILIIDHRNFDYIVKNGKSPSKNIYYQVGFSDAAVVDIIVDAAVVFSHVVFAAVLVLVVFIILTLYKSHTSFNLPAVHLADAS